MAHSNRTIPNPIGDLMKLLKFLLILLVVYAGIVTVFESLLGYYQPTNDGTLRITTMGNGEPHTRVLARIAFEEKLYVAVNHWPRGWYSQALANPEVTIEMDGQTGKYQAVEITDSDEFAVVDAARPLGIGFIILTGFPPRRILRLDPIST